MNENHLIKMISEIVEEATNLKNKHIDLNNTPVNYARIFSQSKEEYENLLKVTRNSIPEFQTMFPFPFVYLFK